jgi:hypothetical protein
MSLKSSELSIRKKIFISIIVLPRFRACIGERAFIGSDKRRFTLIGFDNFGLKPTPRLTKHGYMGWFPHGSSVPMIEYHLTSTSEV